MLPLLFLWSQPIESVQRVKRVAEQGKSKVCTMWSLKPLILAVEYVGSILLERSITVAVLRLSFVYFGCGEDFSGLSALKVTLGCESVWCFPFVN